MRAAQFVVVTVDRKAAAEVPEVAVEAPATKSKKATKKSAAPVEELVEEVEVAAPKPRAKRGKAAAEVPEVAVERKRSRPIGLPMMWRGRSHCLSGGLSSGCESLLALKYAVKGHIPCGFFIAFMHVPLGSWPSQSSSSRPLFACCEISCREKH